MIRIMIALVAATAMLHASAWAATTTTVVDIPVGNRLDRILYLEPDAPTANIVVIPGGNGIFGIQNDGTSQTLTFRCSPAGRNRQAYADQGYAVALVDASASLLAVVNYMNARHNVPTWIFGGSASAAVSTSLANDLPASSPVGLVLFAPSPVPASAVATVTRPTLVIYHGSDVNHFSGQVFSGLTSAPVKEVIIVTGGGGGGGFGCGHHLFEDADAGFVAGTAGFVQRHNNSFATTPSTALAVEFYNTALDHYFITHITNEIALLDAGTTIRGWTRTGQSFNVYTAASTGTSPVCRFYIPPDKGDSHFYGRGTAECDGTAANNPTFVNEAADFFHVKLPVAGVCPAGTRPVYRVFSNRSDANHRYAVDRAVRDTMTGRGWLAEGDGPDLVVMCSPQ